MNSIHTNPKPLPEPSNVAERALIGALIQDGAAYPVAVSVGVVDESFTDAECRDAWVAVRCLHEKGKPVDPLTVSELMSGDQAENMLVLGELMDACPTSVNARAYAEQVADAHRRERLRTAARMVVESLAKGGAVDVVAEQLKAAGEAVGGAGAADCGLSFEDAANFIETTPPPLDPIIDGAFERGDKVELVGGSKQRKSFFLIDFLLHLAAGRDWLGFRIPKRRRVVYVNLELKRDWVHRRIHRTARAYGMTAEDVRGFFRVVNARGKGGIVRQHLAAFVRGEDADLVALDPRYKLMLPGESENAGEGVAGILAMMDDIAEGGSAVLVVHHDSKGDQTGKSVADRGGGSGWAARDVDCKFTLSPQRDDPDNAAIVESMRRNYAPVAPFAVRWEDHRFEMAEDLAAVPFGSEERRRVGKVKAKPTIEDCEPHLLAVAVEAMGRGELLGKAQQRIPLAARQVVRDALDGLVRTGKVASTPRAGQKNGAVKYGLPATIHAYMNPPLPPG